MNQNSLTQFPVNLKKKKMPTEITKQKKIMKERKKSDSKFQMDFDVGMHG